MKHVRPAHRVAVDDPMLCGVIAVDYYAGESVNRDVACVGCPYCTSKCDRIARIDRKRNWQSGDAADQLRPPGIGASKNCASAPGDRCCCTGGDGRKISTAPSLYREGTDGRGIRPNAQDK